MKCDELGKRRVENFQPESPLVIVCEGFHESAFVCSLLRHLGIQNCDVTFPKKKMGKGGISDMVSLIAADDIVKGIAVIRDANGNPRQAFTDACAGFVPPYEVPTESYVIRRGRHRTSAVFLMPGRGRTGALEHLLFDAVTASHSDLAKCITALETCVQRTVRWGENKKAKLRMQCAIACFCEDDPSCSLGFIWAKEAADNPLDITSPVFQELTNFLRDFSQ